MTSQIQHDLSIAYAQVKLSEYQIKNKIAIFEENTDFSIDQFNI